MIRTELREHVFKMLSQIEFNDPADMPDHLKYYFEMLDDAAEKDKKYIQEKFKDKEFTYDKTVQEDGTIIFDIVTSGIRQRYSFTEC